MTNEQQLRTIAVNSHAQVVSGPHKGTVGIVVDADWVAKKVSLEDENAPFDDNIVCDWKDVQQDGSEPVGVPAPQQPGTITWIKYDRENPPKTEKPYLVSDGFVIGEADLLLLRDGPWFSGPFAPADKDITHYAHINLPEVQA